MRDRLRFMAVYFCFWLSFFLVARIIFLAYHIQDTKDLTLETIFGVFQYGIKMDLSMSAYLCLLPYLWVSFSNFIKKGIFQKSIFVYTFFWIAVLILIVLVDLETYNIWTFRIDSTPLLYLKSPKEAFASIKSSPVFALLISFIVLLAVASNIVYRILANKIYDWKVIKAFPFLVYGVLISAVLIIPIRGGFGIAPMNHSSVYFSNVNFANIAALNAPWNFFSSIIHKNSNKVNPYTYLPRRDIEKNFDSLYFSSGKYPKVISDSVKKPNVLLIIWESFTEKALQKRINNQEITPYFSQWAKKGLYYSNMYASGDRTDKGLPAILSSYPAQPTESIIKTPTKSSSLPVLTDVFLKNGYATSFYYGGDAEFANMKSYLLKANFDKIIDVHDFPSELDDSKWGIKDEYLFNKHLNDFAQVGKKPFFSTMLTLSSHEPFDVAPHAIFTGTDVESKFMNSINYTDKCLNDFLTKAEKMPWWKNTLVIIVADHGHKMPISKSRKEDFRIPMLWTGGIIKKPLVVSKIGSQLDISKTLLAQLGMEHKQFEYSKNILDPKTPEWAHFVFNDGFGIVKGDQYVVFDNKGKIQIEGNVPKKSKLELAGKALLQKNFQDYLDR
ncbi:MAG: LTA synthase family protein [Leadbetterella sp.]